MSVSLFEKEHFRRSYFGRVLAQSFIEGRLKTVASLVNVVSEVFKNIACKTKNLFL